MNVGRIGSFQILGTLGKGAHSSILHIRRSKDSRQYALKVVPLEKKEDLKFLEQARHEFRVAQMLDHPALVKLYALETPRDWLFRVRKAHLLIEYVNGKTLDTIQGLTIPRLVQVFLRISEGLVHMHRRGVCHADLKPNNVMVSRTGDVKVIDYGLAWIKGEPKGRVQGTPEYMAPEQVQRGVVNEATDIYNLGATMYRMATWKLPPSTKAASDSASLNAKAFEKMLKPVRELNPNVPAALADLIHHCLRYSVRERPERVSEIQGELDRLADELVQGPEDRLEAMEW